MGTEATMTSWKRTRRGTSLTARVAGTIFLLGAYSAALGWVTRDKEVHLSDVVVRLVEPANGAFLAPGSSVLIKGEVLGNSEGLHATCNGHRSAISGGKFEINADVPLSAGNFFMNCAVVLPGGRRVEQEGAFFVVDKEQLPTDDDSDLIVRIPLSFLTQSSPNLPRGVLTAIEEKTRVALRTLISAMAAKVRLPLVGEIVSDVQVEVASVEADLVPGEFDGLSLKIRISGLEIFATVTLDGSFSGERVEINAKSEKPRSKLSRLRRGLLRRAKGTARKMANAIPESLHPRLPLTVRTDVEAVVPLSIGPGESTAVAVSLAGKPHIGLGEFQLDVIGLDIRLEDSPASKELLQVAVMAFLTDQVDKVVRGAAESMMSRIRLPSRLFLGQRGDGTTMDLGLPLRIDAMVVRNGAIWCKLKSDHAIPIARASGSLGNTWTPPDSLQSIRGDRLTVAAPVATLNRFLGLLWEKGSLEHMRLVAGFLGIDEITLGCQQAPVLFVDRDRNATVYFPSLLLEVKRNAPTPYRLGMAAMASVGFSLDQQQGRLGFVLGIKGDTVVPHLLPADVSGELLQTELSRRVLGAALRTLGLDQRRWTVYFQFQSPSWFVGSTTSRLVPATMAVAREDAGPYVQIDFQLIDDGGS